MLKSEQDFFNSQRGYYSRRAGGGQTTAGGGGGLGTYGITQNVKGPADIALEKLLLTQQGAATAQQQQTQVLKTISNSLSTGQGVTVNIDGREIAASISRSGMSSR